MKKSLTRIKKEQLNIENVTWLHDGVYGDFKNIIGDVSGIYGDVSNICGYVSDIKGYVNGIKGNIDDCGISEEERMTGVNIEDLIQEVE